MREISGGNQSVAGRVTTTSRRDLPDFDMEQEIPGLIAGIDEAGRGPWAGPVVAAAVILDRDRLPLGINDSKKLSARKREALYDAIMETAMVGIGAATVAEIDDLNILQATFLAMKRALDALPVAPCHALVDGNRLPPLGVPATSVIKGDGRSLSIAAASIIAKTYRDRLMTELAKKHPAYGWEQNAGYGTAAHARALALVGISNFHRRSFAPIRKLLIEDSDPTS